MINHAELDNSGWTFVEGIKTSSELLELGRTIGQPIPSPNGEMVKQIKVTPSIKASPGSQSSMYDTGPFPLHTDTVFWPIPVRYVLLRAEGDLRRPTTVMSFMEIFKSQDKKFANLVRKSIWLTCTMSKPFYCSLELYDGVSIGWRYDKDLMVPVNEAAKEVDSLLRSLVMSSRTNNIDWQENSAVILSNWKVLHGRGAQPPDEGLRIIERIYVR